MEIPDFIAGMMYGLTSVNHLTEIEVCYQDGVGIDQYVKTALQDLKHGGTDYDLQAVINFGLAALNVPVMLKGCESMGDDLHAIGSWATIFEHPGQLTATVSKNYLLHRKAIDSDIASLKSDWAAHEYFKAGVDAANLLTVAIGPIQVNENSVMTSVYPQSFELMSVPDFIAGFFYGFTDENHLSEIEACYQGAELELSLFDNALKELEKGEIIKAAKDLSKAFAALSTDLNACKMTSMGDDVKALEEWASIFTHPTKLVTTAGTHYELHKKAIMKDIADEKTDFSTGKYFEAGIATADALELLLGPVYPKTTSSNEMPGFTVMEIPEFVAGFFAGFTDENHLTEIQACYKGFELEISLFDNALKELEKGELIKASKDLSKAFGDLQTDLEACKTTSMANDIKALEDWASIFTHPTKLVTTAGTHYELHKRAITQDITDEKTEFAAAKYFEAGKTTADVLELLLGPVYPKTEVVLSSNEMLGFTAMEIPDFVAGLLYGWTGDNNLTEIEACFNSDLPILEDLKRSTSELFHGHIIKSVEIFEKAVFNL